MVLFYLALKQKWKVHIKLQFATLQSNAVLLYNGRYNNKNDFVAIQIINGQVQFTVSTGKDAASALTNVRGGVNDGEWHTVTAVFKNQVSLLNCLLPRKELWVNIFYSVFRTELVDINAHLNTCLNCPIQSVKLDFPKWKLA